MHVGLCHVPDRFLDALSRSRRRRRGARLRVDLGRRAFAHSGESPDAVPGRRELPKMYYEAMDPFVALASAAGVTRTLKLATGVCLLIPARSDPDRQAGRVARPVSRAASCLASVAAGTPRRWRITVHASTSVFRILRERVEAMKAIWSEEQAAYHGEFVNFDPIFAWPKPVQKPHPTDPRRWWIPGRGEARDPLRHGWIPVGDPQGALARMPELRKIGGRGGPQSRFDRGLDLLLPARSRSAARLRDGGITRAIFAVPSEPREKVLPILDHYRSVVQQLG